MFEGANLDHSVEFEKYFLKHDDKRGATIMRVIHNDEIKHVEFGLRWLRKLKPPHVSDFDAWQEALHWPIRPLHAKGDDFQNDARLAAGMDQTFIDQLRAWTDDNPP